MFKIAVENGELSYSLSGSREDLLGDFSIATYAFTLELSKRFGGHANELVSLMYDTINDYLAQKQKNELALACEPAVEP